MFKIVKNPEFTHKVPVQVPVDGGFSEQTLRCRFRVLSADEMAIHNLETVEGTESYLRAICARFEDVADEDGQIIPHSDELMTQLLGISYVRMALIRAYTAAMSKARLGN